MAVLAVTASAGSANTQAAAKGHRDFHSPCLGVCCKVIGKGKSSKPAVRVSGRLLPCTPSALIKDAPAAPSSLLGDTRTSRAAASASWWCRSRWGHATSTTGLPDPVCTCLSFSHDDHRPQPSPPAHRFHPQLFCRVPPSAAM